VEQVLRTLPPGGLETFSLDANNADEGFPDTVGAPSGSLSDDLVEQRLTSVGAKLGRFWQVESPVGDMSAVGYHRVEHRALFYGQLLVVHLGDADVVITVTSTNSSRVFTIEQEVERTLQPL
jgi:hypothetical protein